MVRILPTTAGALLADGKITTHTAVRGDVAPNLHPLIQRFLLDLPVERRERYAGWCAEAVLISDRLYEANATTVSEARQAMWGAMLQVTGVREAVDPAHGRPVPPCRSCAELIEWLGASVVPS